MYNILELFGIAAFAVSGAFVGVKKRLDILGILVLAIVTACGGGIIRDVVLNKTVPVFFYTPEYLLTTIIVTAVVCLWRPNMKQRKKYNMVLLLFDAIGLGVFSILAAYSAMEHNMPYIGIVFLGCISGCGGGMLRDILVREIPVVLKKEVYLAASIIGIIYMIIFKNIIEEQLLLISSICIIVIVRMLTLIFNIEIPKISMRKNKTEEEK